MYGTAKKAPAVHAMAPRCDAELDEIEKEEDEFYSNRSQLFEERTSMQQQLDALFAERCESSARFCEANDQSYENLNGDQARRAERRRAQKEAEEEKQKVCVLQLQEEASRPAFQLKIEDCDMLIDFFSGKSTTTIVSSEKPEAGYAKPAREVRQVEAAPDNLTIVTRKKKGEEQVTYFVSGRDENKGKKGPKVNGAAAAAEVPLSSSNVNLTFATLPTLPLDVYPPSAVTQADMPHMVEDLMTKKAWFETN
jgi:hypothetical protein